MYYITHITNLPSIIEKGILSHDIIEQDGINYTKVHDDVIISNRREIKTPNGQSLWKFANVYFKARNPMLYRVIREKSLNEVVVLAIRRDILNNPNIYITDGNAVSSHTKIYTAEMCDDIIPTILKEIEGITWWTEVSTSKRKIMAEILVPDRVPPEYIEAIYVANHQVADNVKDMLSSSSDLTVIPQPDMFFEPERKIDLTDNLSVVDGDMFFSRLQTLTISVNTVGVMGKGLAARAKWQFPDVYVNYERLCRNGTLKMGKPYLYKREASFDYELADKPSRLEQSDGERWFLLFPTKGHWRENADIKGIEKGLEWLLSIYLKAGIKSLAIPALGCGLGNLEWKDMGPILCKSLSRMNIPVWIYLPAEKTIPDEFLTKEFLLK